MSDAPAAASTSDLVMPHASAASAVLATFGVDDQIGLDEAQTGRLREKYGFNQLTEVPPIPAWRKLLAQFKDLVIWILIFAAIVSGALGEWVDTIAILAIVLLNGVIGFLQEERAEQAMAALQKLSAPMAKVLRAGSLASLPARELVPGDILELEAGDSIPADSRLLQAFSLTVQEAALTGESLPVEKDADVVLDAATTLGEESFAARATNRNLGACRRPGSQQLRPTLRKNPICSSRSALAHGATVPGLSRVETARKYGK